MKAVICVLLIVLVLFSLCGCKSKEQDLGEITSFTFERTNGSVWGRQFIFSADKDKVYVLNFFPKETYEYETLSDLDLENWEEIEQALTKASLTLEPKKEPGFVKKLVRKLFASAIVDGTDNYKLSIGYENGYVEYEYVANQSTIELESLLDATANNLYEKACAN